MALSNRVHDIGFPFRIIITSKYIKSMRNIFKDDLNKCLVNASREVHINCDYEIETSIKKIIEMPRDKTPAEALIMDKRVGSKRSLKELELWYESYVNKQLSGKSNSSDNDSSQNDHDGKAN